LPEPPGSIVNQDEAFTRALRAMYWGGYWTAVYHVTTSQQYKLTLFGQCQRNICQKRHAENNDGDEHEDAEVEDV